MTDHDTLLSAILAHPEEDTPRLILADWLQEHGQEKRAEFIRCQVEAVRSEPFCPQARKASAAAEELLEEHRGDWARGCRQWLLDWHFERGFVEHADVNVVTFPHDAERLCRATPLRSLRPVRYASEESVPPLDAFFQTPQLRAICRLDLSQLGLPGDYFDLITGSPHLANITDLCLRGCPIPPDWLQDLLLGGAIPRLAHLDLGDVPHLGPRLADVLPKATHRVFRGLNLNHIVFASNQLKAVLGSRCLREVEELRLAWMTGTGRQGALMHLDLGWVIPAARLRLLDLNGQGIGNTGVEELLREFGRKPCELPLRWLGLANNLITTDGLRILERAPASRLKLYHLDLRGNGLSQSCLPTLQSRFPDAMIKL